MDIAWKGQRSRGAIIHLQILPNPSRETQKGVAVRYATGSRKERQGVKVVNFTSGNMFAGAYRLNAAQKPFGDPAIRRVLWKLVDQREVTDGLGLDAKYATPCATFFTCGTTYDSKAGTEAAANPSIEAPRISAQVLAEKLKQAGFNVDLQVMDWASGLPVEPKRRAGAFTAFTPAVSIWPRRLPTSWWRSSASTSRAGNSTRALRRCWMLSPRRPPRRTAEDRSRDPDRDVRSGAGHSVGAVRPAGGLSRPSAWSDTIRNSDFLECREIAPCMTSL
jgi:hypothetical protein